MARRTFRPARSRAAQPITVIRIVVERVRARRFDIRSAAGEDLGMTETRLGVFAAIAKLEAALESGQRLEVTWIGCAPP